MHIEELWASPSPKARLIRGLLVPAGWLYGAAWQGYLALYRFRFKKPWTPRIPVLCVGNLVVGGTGKTPTTIHMADLLLDLGYAVVIGTSGYGSGAAESAHIAPDGSLSARAWGDEAALIRHLRPQIPLVVGRDRVEAARLAQARYPQAILLMDDGFQHLPLKKDVTILLDPPMTNRRTLPAGPYREPAQNRTRADLAIPGEFHLEVDPLTFDEPISGSVDVLCALGRPSGFLASIDATGLQRKTTVLRPDHDRLHQPDLLEPFDSHRAIVVTGKDWVKIRERPDVGKYRFAVARHSVRIEPSDAFRSWLQAKLNGISDQAI